MPYLFRRAARSTENSNGRSQSRSLFVKLLGGGIPLRHNTHRLERIGILAGAVLFAAVNAAAANETTVATAVLGHPDFLHCGPNNAGPSGFDGPSAVTTDSQGHIYVTDSGNNRVLGWKDAASLQNGAPADLVIGQPDFQSIAPNDGVECTISLSVGSDTLDSPGGIAVDPAGNLYVADTGNHRVLEYDAPFVACSSFPCVANRVFGQDGVFTTSECNLGKGASGIGSDSLCMPTGVAVDALGNLYVSDEGNNRVLEYNNPLGADPVGGAGYANANMVFGQNGSFALNACFNGNLQDLGGISADSLCEPTGVAVDVVGNLYVVDSSDNRVLKYNTPLNSNSGEAGAGDTTADLVFGQDSFSHGECDEGTAPGDIEFLDSQQNATTIGPDSLCLDQFRSHGSVGGVSVDASGHVYVADYFNNRVLEFAPEVSGTATESNSPIAERVFGEDGSFVNGIGRCNSGSNLGDLYGIGSDSLCHPGGLALDSHGALFIADSGNNRVFGFDAPMSTTGPSADLVLGQTDFVHNSINALDGTGLKNPGLIAVDLQNRLYVSDTSNNRVLAWRNASDFAKGAAADLVIGQTDFRTNAADFLPDLHPVADDNICTHVGADTLCEPTGLTTDTAGNLFVADSANNRVLEYDTPFVACSSFPCVANRVFGQNGVFTTSECNFGKGASGIGSESLCNPTSVAVDPRGNLYVSDAGNNRVLEYNIPLSANRSGGSGDARADMVFGQSNFVSTSCGLGEDSFCLQAQENPRGPSGAVAVDAVGDLYVADSGNNRVIKYNTPLNSNGSAPIIFGQNSLSSDSGCAPGSASGDPNDTGPGTLCDPVALALDGGGNLYVSDFGNDRVLEYNSGDTTADQIFGQNGNFSNSGSGCPSGTAPGDLNGLGPDTLCGPKGLAVDRTGDLLIADGNNNRVLRYDSAATPFAPASALKSVLGSAGGSLQISDRAIAFGSVGLQTTLTKSILVKNAGLTGTITGEVVSPQNTAYSVTTGGGSFALSPGESMQVAVEFSPPTTSSIKDELLIVVNDTKHSTSRISLSGRGAPGSLAVPLILKFPRAKPAQAVTLLLRIFNRGEGVLHGSVGPATTPFFVSGGGAFRLGKDESLHVAITFASPLRSSEFRTSLVISSDDPSHPQSTVVLAGRTK